MSLEIRALLGIASHFYELFVLKSGSVKRLRGGHVFKAHRLLYHSTRGSGVIKNKVKVGAAGAAGRGGEPGRDRVYRRLFGNHPTGVPRL